MAPRPAWKGYLKLSLVSCAVELSNATTYAEKVSFRTINRKSGNPVRRQYIDSVSGKPVSDEDEVRGYEIDDDQFLLVEDEEIEAVQIESSHTLSIETFVDRADVEQIYLDTPYYLAPADDMADEAFAVIRDAMARRKMAGLTRIVLYRRERPALIEPLGRGLLLTTLRYDANVRRPEDMFGDLSVAKTDKEMVDLAVSIIDRKKGKFDPSRFEDAYETALLDLIKAKQKGRKAPVVKAAAPPSNVVNLFEALKKSLAGEGSAGGGAAGRNPASSPKSSPPAKSGKRKAGKAGRQIRRKSA
jgi:DNA end-binding protein Ku